ncbi:MAG TPA: type II toxin-antitoxin system VapC family toxin [Rhizomicrobium sp.]|jgi:predicted nucleic acid-binding protein
MIVVDSSVAAKWFLEEPGTLEAEALQEHGDSIAPDLIIPEVLNTIWKNVRLKRIVPAQMKLVAAALPSHLAWIVSTRILAGRAAEIAVELDHPVYDCFYIALAEREGCTLVSADQRLQRKIRRTKFAKIVKPLLHAPRAT